jgi:hypothetical protein
VSAHGFAIQAKLAGNGRDGQSLPMKVEYHHEFSQLDHRAPPARLRGKHRRSETGENSTLTIGEDSTPAHIKLHKAQLASDRMSCHRATANQVRLALHTAACWLMHTVRAAIPTTSSLANAEFATIRERLIKIGARVIENIARIRIHLPTSCPERVLFRAVALGIMPSAP